MRTANLLDFNSPLRFPVTTTYQILVILSKSFPNESVRGLVLRKVIQKRLATP